MPIKKWNTVLQIVAINSEIVNWNVISNYQSNERRPIQVFFYKVLLTKG